MYLLKSALCKDMLLAFYLNTNTFETISEQNGPIDCMYQYYQAQHCTCLGISMVVLY